MKPIMKQPVKNHPLYPDRDPMLLGQHYPNHVLGMTEAGLYEKSDIAVQLAWRDQRIAELEVLLESQNSSKS